MIVEKALLLDVRLRSHRENGVAVGIPLEKARVVKCLDFVLRAVALSYYAGESIRP